MRKKHSFASHIVDHLYHVPRTMYLRTYTIYAHVFRVFTDLNILRTPIKKPKMFTPMSNIPNGFCRVEIRRANRTAAAP